MICGSKSGYMCPLGKGKSKDFLKIINKVELLKIGIYSVEDIKRICRLNIQTDFLKSMLFEISVLFPNKFKYTENSTMDRFTIH